MNNLLKLRIDSNLSQEALANSIGISKRAYIYYEKQERDIPSSVLIKLADYFDVSIDYLVGRTDKR